MFVNTACKYMKKGYTRNTIISHLVGVDNLAAWQSNLKYNHLIFMFLL